MKYLLGCERILQRRFDSTHVSPFIVSGKWINQAPVKRGNWKLRKVRFPQNVIIVKCMFQEMEPKLNLSARFATYPSN